MKLKNGAGVQMSALAQAGKRFRARMRARYPNLRAPDDVEGSPAPPPVPESALDGVIFAFKEAREAAEGAELTWSDFANSVRSASGPSGYSVTDVRAIIKESRGG